MNRLKKAYEEDYLLYWTNISRATTLLIILNISMFFLTGLVTTQRYFYTFFSIVALSVTARAVVSQTVVSRTAVARAAPPGCGTGSRLEIE